MTVKACLFVLALMCASPSFATPIVSVSPRPGDPLVANGSFHVDVSIADAVDLIGYQFDLAFEPGVISLDGLATEGPFLTNSGSFQTLFSEGLDSPGTISFILGSLFLPDTVSGSGVLASLSFIAAPTGGTSSLTLSNVQLFQEINGDPLELFDFSTVNGAATIAAPTDTTPVPEPTTMLLVGTGVAAALRKRRARIAR